MKKIVLSFFSVIFSVCSFNAQNYTTGNMTFFTDYSGKVDVTSTTVTVTLVGPSTSWLGIGFDATSMDDIGKDVVIFDGTSITDRSFDGLGNTPIPDTQNWTLVSNLLNTPSAGLRTVTMTRARVATQVEDFTFPIAAGPLKIIYARRTGSTLIGYHGGGNCGTLTANLVLGGDDFLMESLKVYPNPSKEYFAVEFPSNITKGVIKVYDAAGKLIKEQNVTSIENKIRTNDLSKGTYFMILRTDYGNATRTLVVD